MGGHLDARALSRYARRTLPVEQLVAADEHLQGCVECRRRLAAVATWPSRLGELTPEAHSLEHISYEQLARYVESRLSAAQRRQVDGHVETCGMCRAELEDLIEFSSGEPASADTLRRREQFDAVVVTELKARARRYLPPVTYAKLDVDALIEDTVGDALLRLDVIQRSDLGIYVWEGVKARVRDALLAELPAEDSQAIRRLEEQGMSFEEAAINVTRSTSLTANGEPARFQLQSGTRRATSSDS